MDPKINGSLARPRSAGGTHPLLRLTTPFLGRKAELAAIQHFLAQGDCRLITITGPDGVGKTRLAVQAAQLLASDFPEGVVLVDIHNVKGLHRLAEGVSEALGIQLRANQDPAVRVMEYLRWSELLLVLVGLDNSADQSAVVAHWLQQAGGLRILAGARRNLDLPGEQVINLSGLIFPSAENDNWLSFPAVELFLEAARNARPDFSAEDEKGPILEICQLLQGNPLALELTASWTRQLSGKEIAARLRQEMLYPRFGRRSRVDALTDLEVLIDLTFEILTPAEQSAFRRLCVFEGGFNRSAALRVAQTDPAVLLGLVEQSLVRRLSADRYMIPERLRQSGFERLKQSPEEEEAVRDQHSDYFTTFLQERMAHMLGGRQKEATLDIQEELNNVRLAWEWSLARVKVSNILGCLKPLHGFFEIQNRAREGAQAFAQALEVLSTQPLEPEIRRGLALINGYIGWDALEVGAYTVARRHLQRSHDQWGKDPPVSGYHSNPAHGLALLLVLEGDPAAGREMSNRALEASGGHRDIVNQAYAYVILASAELQLGEYHSASESVQKGYALVMQADNRWFAARCMTLWGLSALGLDDAEQARHYFQSSFDISQYFGVTHGMAAALNHLGRVALLQTNPVEAIRLYERSLGLCLETGDDKALATALGGLGSAACQQNSCEDAWPYLRAALEIAPSRTLQASLLVEAAALLAQVGKQVQADSLLADLLDHSVLRGFSRRDALVLRNRIALDYPPVLLNRRERNGRPAGLQEMTAMLKAHEIEWFPPYDIPIGLAEPIIHREQEILSLVSLEYNNSKICEALNLTTGALKWYLGHLCHKLRVETRPQAVARARALGLIA